MLMALFSVLVLAPVTLNLIGSTRDFARFVDAVNLSMMVLIFWVVTNFMALIFDFPTSKVLHAAIDFIGLGASVRLWRHDRAIWKLTLAGLFLIQLGLHGAFWVDWSTHPAAELAYNYIRNINIVWLAELAVVAWPGGRYVVGSVLDRSLHRRRVHHRAGPGG